MSIAEFRKHLKKGTGAGAAWLKADFHIHTPGSSDYEYKKEDAEQKLGETLRNGEYRFAVILKHQEFPTRDELKRLQEHCPHTTLIPGAEINVLVDALFKKIGKDYFFHCIVAVDPDSDVDFDFVLNTAKRTFSYRDGDYPAGFRSNILDIGRFFRKEGALFIPAHLHQSKSPENSRSIDDLYDDDAFLGFIRDEAFDALEVRDPNTATFFTGGVKTKEGSIIPAAVCVASSDAHQHDHIVQRNRSTWIRSENPTFEELKAALSFRHRVSLKLPTINHARIVGVHVKGSFIPEVWMPLNEGLNALIGSKGSGKTALVECIRFALNTHVPSDRHDAVTRHIQHVLGSSGYVECLVQTSNGSELLITRRADSPDRISILDNRGEQRILGTSDEIPFPISILGWHEIEAVADKAEARVSLLDRIGNAAEIRGYYDSIALSVEQARDLLPSLQRKVKKLETSLREMWQLQNKRATLVRLAQTELVSLQEQYEWFLSAEQRTVGLQNSVRDRSARIPEALQSHISLEISNPPAHAHAEEMKNAISKIDGTIRDNEQLEKKTTLELEGGLANISVANQEAADLIKASFTHFRDEIYTPKVNALPAEDREMLTKHIQILEETKRLPLIERQCTESLAEVRSLSAEIKRYCDAIRSIRNAIVEKRTALVEELNKDLIGVRLNFLPFANQSSRTAFQNRYGADSTLMVQYMQTFGKQSSYDNLAEAFDTLSKLDLDQSKWKVDDALYDVKFVEMFDVLDDDDVEISLQVGKAGYVPIQNLSAGQRCVAVFPLLLRNTKGPLIIDQPEDNLDNRYIADNIGPDLLERKQRQQFLVTSHNANLVVLTDADLIVHVDSDGARATFPAAGFLSCESSEIRKSILDVLDGGEAALTARQKKYGVSAPFEQ